LRGTTLGQYRITGSIGLGGMGAVYSAEHTLLGRAAAIKLLLPEVSRDQEVVTRFFNEARTAAAIRHPSIVEIYDFGWHTDGSAYLVMEHLRGESLAARLAYGRMPVAKVMMIIRQISGALAAVHRIGIVHRDLKPENIFLVPDPDVVGGERIKLLDFGIAKLVAENDQHRMTRPGTILGTPTYMSPEQCRGEPVDHRADLYSLGCITFELCTGRPPFVDAGIRDLLISHVHAQPPSVSSLTPGISPVLDGLVQRLLVKDVQLRVQSAETVVQAIDAATDAVYRSGGQPVVTLDPGHPDRPLATMLWADASGDALRASPATGRYRRFAGLGVAAVLGAVVAMIALGALGHRSDRDSPPSSPATRPAPVADPATPVRLPIASGSSSIDAGRLDAQDASLVAAPASRPPAPAGVVASGIVGPRTTTPAGSPPYPDAEAARRETVEGIVQLYVAVGQALKILDQHRGSGATADLWPSFTRIHINDVIMDPAKRVEAERRLRQLRDQIAERSR
jgi:serine/threonine-protein kinase